MKKLIQINTVCNTSTGKLMGDIQRKANEMGYETLSIVGRRKVYPDIRCEKIGNGISFWIHVAITTILDRQGYGSYFVTRKIVSRLRQENPDIIHLHNLHGYYLNLPVLFDYLSKEFKGDYSHVKLCGNQVIMYDGKNCSIFMKNGIQKFKGRMDNNILEMFPVGGVNQYIVLSANGMEKVRLVK